MSAEKFTPEQSLQLIRTMIEKVKQDVTENSFFLLLWGWLVFAAAILHYAFIMAYVKAAGKKPGHFWMIRCGCSESGQASCLRS